MKKYHEIREGDENVQINTIKCIVSFRDSFLIHFMNLNKNSWNNIPVY